MTDTTRTEEAVTHTRARAIIETGAYEEAGDYDTLIRYVEQQDATVGSLLSQRANLEESAQHQADRIAELQLVALEAAAMLSETNHGGLTFERSESMRLALQAAGVPIPASCAKCPHPPVQAAEPEPSPPKQAEGEKQLPCSQCGQVINPPWDAYALFWPGADGLRFCRKSCAAAWQDAHPKPTPAKRDGGYRPTEALRREIVEALRAAGEGWADMVADRLERKGGEGR